MDRDTLFRIGRTAAFFLLIVAFIIGCNVQNRRLHPKKDVITIHDTTLIERTDTIIVEVPREVVRNIVRYDTLTIHDSIDIEVPIPIESIAYNDTIQLDSTEVIYNAWVSGYEANLDSLGFIIHSKFNQVNTTTTTTIRKGGRWGFAVTAGYYGGWDMYRNQFSSGLGLMFGLTYKITK